MHLVYGPVIHSSKKKTSQNDKNNKLLKITKMKEKLQTSKILLILFHVYI